ncbi:MAG: alcohol dehydrogenase catalytic domain-containing protein [Salinibacterium sp.]|nr:alcohol dehydrogenase catalytic domain-containing protein [Salinibacterium sp.]
MPHAALPTSSRQVLFSAPDTIEHAVSAVDAPGPDEAIVRIALVGICATDLHLLAGHIGDPFPLVPGHEFVGAIAAIGDRASAARGLHVGDHVAVEMLLPCRACARCREGRYNLCDEDDMARGLARGRQYGVNIPRTVSPGLWGGYAEYLFVPAEAITHKLPSTMPWTRAVLAEPLAVASRAVARGRVSPGDTVVVIGPGPVGILTAAAARAAGARKVIMVGTRTSRLALSLSFGADAAVDSRDCDPVVGVRELIGGQLADVVVEVAGVPAAQQQAVSLVRRGGRVVLAGACGAHAVVSFLADEDLLTREIDILPSFLSSGGFEPAIALLERHDFPFEQLVTHSFAFEDVDLAYDLIRSRSDDVLKAVLDPSAERSR